MDPRTTDPRRQLLGHQDTGPEPVGKRCYEVLLKDQAGGPAHCDNELLSRGILQYGARRQEFKNAGNGPVVSMCKQDHIVVCRTKFAKMEVIWT